MRSLLVRERVADEPELAESGPHESEAEGKTGRCINNGAGGRGVDVRWLKAEGD